MAPTNSPTPSERLTETKCLGAELPWAWMEPNFVLELIRAAKPAQERLKAADPSDLSKISTYLQVSARHVGVARLGAKMFENPEPLVAIAGDATGRTASLLMVYGSGQTSIDLCAAMLLRWHGVMPSQDEHDFLDLKEAKRNKSVSLTSDESDWYQAISGSQLGRDLTDLRHSITHRTLRMAVNVNMSRGRNKRRIGPSDGPISNEDAISTLNRHAGFVEERWRDFVDLAFK